MSDPADEPFRIDDEEWNITHAAPTNDKHQNLRLLIARASFLCLITNENKRLWEVFQDCTTKIETDLYAGMEMRVSMGYVCDRVISFIKDELKIDWDWLCYDLIAIFYFQF